MIGFEDQVEEDNFYDDFFYCERINVSDFFPKEMPRKNSINKNKINLSNN